MTCGSSFTYVRRDDVRCSEDSQLPIVGVGADRLAGRNVDAAGGPGLARADALRRQRLCRRNRHGPAIRADAVSVGVGRSTRRPVRQAQTPHDHPGVRRSLRSGAGCARCRQHGRALARLCHRLHPRLLVCHRRAGAAIVHHRDGGQGNSVQRDRVELDDVQHGADRRACGVGSAHHPRRYRLGVPDQRGVVRRGVRCPLWR